jgi:DNA-binding response OmpR family regulator
MANILVIDDDPQIGRLLEKVLGRAGHEVAIALNGKDGQQIFREGNFDLLITDLIMPEKEGLETIMELRREFPETKIIAMSGGGRIGPDSYLKMANTLGAEKTLTKPFGREDLLSAVSALI